MQYPQFKKYFAYRLLSFLGLCECLMLVTHFTMAICVAVQYTLPFALNKVVTAIVNIAKNPNEVSSLAINLDHRQYFLLSMDYSYDCYYDRLRE